MLSRRPRSDSSPSDERKEVTGVGRLAVVTGASSGIGEATAHVLAKRGFLVLAGVRRPADAERLSGPSIEALDLDITDPAQVAAIAERVEKDPLGRRLGALVNNAGVAVNAPVETLPIDEWRRHFEVNLFGHVAMTQALLPALLAGRGRVVNLSSIGGRVAFPTYGAYAASKFALEAMSDVLRREVGRFGVEVIVVEPGTVATGMWSKGLTTMRELFEETTDTQKARYRDLVGAMGEQAEANVREGKGIEPLVAAQAITDAIEARRPRTRYLLGRDANFLARVARVLPDRGLDRLIARSLDLGRPAVPR